MEADLTRALQTLEAHILRVEKAQADESRQIKQLLQTILSRLK
jgi:hypothetical protein